MQIFTWIINIFRGKKKKESIRLELQEGQAAMNNSIAKQIQQDPIDLILDASKIKIKALKEFEKYFDNRLLTNIVSQTEVIHDVFAGNRTLNFKKLDQYHYYYTDHLIELLQKLSQSKNENTSVINTQVKSIEKKIESWKKKSNEILQGDIKKLDNSKAQYAQAMSLQLAAIYNCMVDNFDDFRFKKRASLGTYTDKVGKELAWILSTDQFIKVTDFNFDNQYKYEDYHIERKLMGRLQKNLFMIDFIGICISGDSSFEIFQISETGDYFIYNHERGIFQFLEYRKIQDSCTSANTRYGELNVEINNMEEKRVILKAQLKDIKTLDAKTVETLKQYLQKIEDIELINNLEEVDLERQNLQTVLNMTRIEV